MKLTPEAHEKLKELTKTANTIGVRLSLKKTGCSGYSYEFGFTNGNDDDQVIEKILYISTDEYELLKEAVLGIHSDDFGWAFAISNPRELGRCGCGESIKL